jgi:hypothetical protein
MTGPDDLAAVKNACNTLMAARFAMMTDMHSAVFGEPCASLAEIGLESRYRLTDCRIADALVRARAGVAPKRVVRGEDYRTRTDMPFVFV